MKIHTYTSPTAPASHRAIARIEVAAGFLPVVCKGHDEDEAHIRAQAFWDTEAAKNSPKPIETRIGKPDPVRTLAPPPGGYSPETRWPLGDVRCGIDPEAATGLPAADPTVETVADLGHLFG